MARRSNGGIIGQYNLPNDQRTFGVYRATEAAILSGAGQFPGSTLADSTPQVVPQIGSALKPTITSIQYCDNNYIETSPGANAGPVTGATLRITGQNFFSNTKIYINGNVVNTTNKYISSTEIRTANITLSAGSYSLMAFNTSNIGSRYTAGFQSRPVPVWITNPTLTSANINTSFSYTLSASDASGVTYVLDSGSSLPANTTLSPSGTLAGNVSTIGSYTFVVNAKNAYSMVTPRTFTLRIVTSFTTQYLMIAGGGAGGGYSPGLSSGIGTSGGGGAGGLLQGTRTLVQGTTYSVVVGGGGATNPGPVSPVGVGGTGTPTTFPGLTTASGGGGGGSMASIPGTPNGSFGTAGGSGGGAGYLNSTNPTGTGTPGQGFPGGTAPALGIVAGGGGAGGAGLPSTTSPGIYSGGVGIASTITGANIGYAGGGGGGGGVGSGALIGGYGAVSNRSGTTGSGAGGAASQTGGSGNVILSYPTPFFTGATFGSPNNVVTLTDGGNTVVIFTGSSTFTP